MTKTPFSTLAIGPNSLFVQFSDQTQQPIYAKVSANLAVIVSQPKTQKDCIVGK